MSKREDFAQGLDWLLSNRDRTVVRLAQVLASDDPDKAVAKTWQNRLSRWRYGEQLPELSQWRLVASQLSKQSSYPKESIARLGTLLVKARAEPLGVEQTPITGTGRVVSSTWAYGLGVHRSIELADPADVVEKMSDQDVRPDPELPVYVPRAHDAELGRRVRAAAGQNAAPVMVTLVGGSSAGKTRSLWEAVWPLLADGWILHQPVSCEELVQLVGEGVADRSVVWLDELQNFLPCGSGDAGAVALKRLLDTRPADIAASSTRSRRSHDDRSEDRGDGGAGTLVVATIWPDTLTAVCATRSDATTPLVQRLLEGTLVPVSDGFTGPELEQAATSSDARVREAARTGGRMVTQTLAGGTFLVERYEGRATTLAPAYGPGAMAVLRGR